MANERPAEGGTSLLVAAFDHWLSGLVFAIFVSCAVVGASGLPIMGWVFRSIEAHGVDVAMRTRILFAPLSPIGDEAHIENAGYVFIDLDTPLCMRVTPSKFCDTRSPASSRAASIAAIAAIRAKAKVVIIDVQLWDLPEGANPSGADLRTLAATAKANPEVGVIAAAPFRPAEMLQQGVWDTTLLPPELRGSAIKFAPAFAWIDPSDNEDVIRRYPERVVAARENEQRGPSLVATMPYLAARYLGLGGGRDGTGPERAAENPPRSPLLLYTLPSLVPQGGEARAGVAATFQGLYDRYPASRVLNPDGTLKVDASLLQGKAVIVSTSARTALDWHETPIGEMTGAEVILNATRAMRAGASIYEPALSEKLLREILAALVASIPFLAFWIAAEALRRRMVGGVVVTMARNALLLALFALTLMFAAAALVVFILGLSSAAFLRGEAIEFFTPLAALSLESFTHGAAKVLEAVAGAVAATRRGVFRAFRRLAEMLARAGRSSP